MQDDFFLALVMITCCCYMLARISSFAEASRDKRLKENMEEERKKKVDSLYGR